MVLTALSTDTNATITLPVVDMLFGAFEDSSGTSGISETAGTTYPFTLRATNQSGGTAGTFTTIRSFVAVVVIELVVMAFAVVVPLAKLPVDTSRGLVVFTPLNS